jgi:hypothetical protein
MTGVKVTKPKTALGSSLGEDVGLGNNCFYDIKRYVSSDQAYDKLLGNK